MACSLSSHVMNTTLGTPGRNLQLTLEQAEEDGSWKQLFRSTESRQQPDAQISNYKL